MKGRGPLLAAILLGVAAAFLYWLDLRNAKQSAREGWELQPVVVASDDIDEGVTLTSEMVSQRGIPKQFVTSSVIQPENFNFVIGQKVLVALKRGDPLLWTQFESSKGLERLAKIVSKNLRAVTLAAADKDSVGGWIRPNDHVDVLLTYRDAAAAEISSVTVLRDMLVLATGKITGTTNMNVLSEDDRHYSNVTLQMLPEEAEMLNLAEDVGKVTLILRNPEDLENEVPGKKTTIKTLIDGVRENALITIRHKSPSVQVIEGGK